MVARYGLGINAGANKSAIDQIVEGKDISVIVLQIKYLNNILDRDHRAVKRITKSMLDLSHFMPPKMF